MTEELGFITAAPTPFEEGLLKLDSGLYHTLAGIKMLEEALGELKEMELHPVYREALTEIDGLIQEALIPYLDEADQAFRIIADT